MRGTTPTHSFTLPFDTALIKSVRVIYAHERERILVKNTADCELAGNTVKVTLTQEDTLKFENDCVVEIQMRVLTEDGTALRSDVYKRYAGVLLDDEVLV